MRAPQLLIAFLLLGACTDDGPDPPGPIVGSWRALPSEFDPSPPPPADRQMYTFDADGTLHYAEGPLNLTSTYAVNGDLVTMTDAGIVATGAFYASPTRLLLNAMTRVDGPGPVGTWNQTRTIDGKVHDLVLVLRADQSAHLTARTDGAPTLDDEATWARTGDDLDIAPVSAPPGMNWLRVTLVDDQLGTPYERL